MSIKTLSLLLMTLVYFDVSAAGQVTIYRWIDSNNVVHFSQHQPEHDNYTEISMANNTKSTTKSDKEVSQNVPQSSDNPLLSINANDDAIESLNNDKCDSARENINTLQNFDKIQIKDETGNIKVLSALDKQQQLAMNTKQAEVYCTE